MYILEEIFIKDLNRTGSDVTQGIQFPETIRNGINSNGKKIHYFLNYSGEPQNFKNLFNKGTELVTNKQILHQHELKIASWDMLIIEEW